MYNKNVRYNKNKCSRGLMTTVICVKCTDGFAIGSDSQLSYGTVAKETDFDKIFKIKEKVLVSFSGDWNYFERVKDDISARLVSLTSLDQLTQLFEERVRYMYDNYPINERNYTEIIFGAGIEGKLRFYRINTLDCFAIEIKDFHSMGSGKFLAKYIFKRLWSKELTKLDASCMLAHVIHETTKVDQASNPPINIATIDKSGFIHFSKRENIDSIIKSISTADKAFSYFLREFILHPETVKLNKDGIRIKSDNSEKKKQISK